MRGDAEWRLAHLEAAGDLARGRIDHYQLFAFGRGEVGKLAVADMAMPAGLPPMAISATGFMSASETTVSESPVWLVTKASLTVAGSDVADTQTAMLASIAAVDDNISRLSAPSCRCAGRHQPPASTFVFSASRPPR